MPKTAFPRLGGNQWLDTFYHPPFNTGNIWFIRSTTGTNASGYGRSPELPLASLAYLFSSGTPPANNDDLVVLLPSHSETITAAAGIVCNIAGIHILGRGWGAAQPKITFSTAITADLDIDAADIVFENVHFTANFASITAPLDINAQNCTFRRCRFSETAINMNALIWILGGSTTMSSGLCVEDCVANDANAANTHFISLPGTDEGNIIRRNYLYGDWGTAAIGAAGNVVNLQIHENKIYNAATDIDSCIKVATAGTGYISDNYVTSGAAQANGITAPGCGKCNNYQGVNGEDLSALLDPILT